MITLKQAIRSLHPSSQFVVFDNERIEWMSPDITQPTQEQIKAELARLQSEYDALQYQRDRKAEYPSIEECVHAILDDDLDALQAKRAEIKARYPKP